MRIRRGLLLLLPIALTACATSSPVVIADGATRTSGVTTVNPWIRIGNDAKVEGTLRSINGNLVIGDRARVAALSIVNGSIIGGEGVVVAGDIDSINGGVSFHRGSQVRGAISTINGSIELVGSSVVDVRTVHGDVELRNGSVVRGDIVIEKSTGNSDRPWPLRILVSGGSVIEGDVIVEDPEFKAQLIVRDGGKVLGRVQNIEVVEEPAAEAPQARVTLVTT
jgi:hypothetical protein